MGRFRPSYPPEFKEEAVRLVRRLLACTRVRVRNHSRVRCARPHLGRNL